MAYHKRRDQNRAENLSLHRQGVLEEQRAALAEFYAGAEPGLSVTDWLVKHFPIERVLERVEADGTEVWREEPWVPHKYLSDFLEVATLKDGPRKIGLLKGAQMGFTKAVIGLSLWLIMEKSCKVMNFLPTDSEARNFHRAHVLPTETGVPRFTQLFNAGNRKQAEGTSKVLANGATWESRGGGVGSRYRSFTVDLAIQDELDAYDQDARGEGNPFDLSHRSVQNRDGRVLAGCTPSTAMGPSLIVDIYKNSDIRFVWVLKCPLCGELDDLLWERFDMEPSGSVAKRAASIRYRCGSCGGWWRYGKLAGAMRGGRWQEAMDMRDTDLYPLPNWDGRWIGRGKRGVVLRERDSRRGLPWPRYAAFAAHGLFSVWCSWEEYANRWLRADRKPTKLRVFVEQTLARPWNEVDKESLTPSQIKRHAIPLVEVPDENRLSIVAVDVQLNYLSVAVFLFGPERHGVLVHRREFHGDIETGGSAWDYFREWMCSSDAVFNLRAPRLVVCDVSFQQTHCLRNLGRVRAWFPHEVYPVEGRNIRGSAMFKLTNAKVDGVPTPMFTLNVNSLKFDVRKALASGQLRLVNEGLPEDIEAELLAERLVKRIHMGQETWQWEKFSERDANEALDQSVYATAAYEIIGLSNIHKLPLVVDEKPGSLASGRMPKVSRRRRSRRRRRY